MRISSAVSRSRASRRSAAVPATDGQSACSRAAWRALTALGRCAAAVPFVAVSAAAQAGAAPAPQTEADTYTRYELLAPGSARFRVVYEVTATTPGAAAYFNPIRAGSVATDERVTDRATGRPLAFRVVDAAAAQAGGVRGGDSTMQYIRVALARPVPAEGGARILIEKTYADPKSYHADRGDLVFERSLGIKRNAVVLPAGYELVACDYPSQVRREADGRVAVSFWNTSPAPAPLVVRARPSAGLAAASAETLGAPARFDERARQSRAIVYFLRAPESHAFELYHDYTETRPGTSTYLNVVRAGSTVSNPSARNLDTGEPLRWEILQGAAITSAGLAAPGETVTPATEAVVFRFAPVAPGGSTRLRMYETYVDSARYRLVGDELVWERSVGRPANAVVLPPGWVLTGSAAPAEVSELPDGRVRLDFINPRADEIGLVITARRRSGGR